MSFTTDSAVNSAAGSATDTAAAHAPGADAEVVIEALGLTRRFGDFTAVDDIAIRVARGTIFAFLGANGSGKTTTIRMLIGLLTPTAGSITVAGVDVIRHPRRVREAIGYMGQKVSLYRGLSLHENVEFYGGLHDIDGRELSRRWGMLRERFSLGEAEASRAEDLPAGLRQRAGLALAMLHEPSVLFLDEPTAGVDVELRQTLWRFIRRLNGAGHTIVLTTHYLEEAESLCGRIAMLKEGRVVALDTTANLLRRITARSLRLQLGPGSPLPEVLAARAQESGGQWSLAFDSYDEIETVLAVLRHTGCIIEDMEIGKPDLEDVFVQVMRA